MFLPFKPNPPGGSLKCLWCIYGMAFLHCRCPLLLLRAKNRLLQKTMVSSKLCGVWSPSRSFDLKISFSIVSICACFFLVLIPSACSCFISASWFVLKSLKSLLRNVYIWPSIAPKVPHDFGSNVMKTGWSKDTAVLFPYFENKSSQPML